MKIKADFIETELIISKEYITALEIENKKYFFRFIKNIYDIYNNNYCEEVHFFENDKEISNHNIIILNDYFNIDTSSKKYTAELQKSIINSIDENMNKELMSCYKKLTIILKKILKNIDLPLCITQDYSIESILKLMKISIDQKEELLDTLLLIIDVEKVLKLNRIIFLINLKQYLSKEELNELYKYAIYNDIYIILIDSQSYGVCLKNEKKLIIDENLDEFMLE